MRSAHLLWVCAAILVWLAIFPNLRIANPWFKEFLPETNFSGTFTGTIEHGFLSRGRYGFYADDCITGIRLDGSSVYSHSCQPCDHCSVNAFDLPRETARGTHSIDIDVRNLGGRGFLRIPTRANTFIRFLLWVLAGSGAIMIARRNKAWAAYGIVIFALTVGFFYSAYTPLYARSYDLGGHYAYVEFLKNELHLPRVGQFWESYQPPLYYAVIALLGGVGVTAPDVSYLFFALTLVWFFARTPSWIGVGLLGLLPASVYFTSRLSNDVFFPFYGLVFLVLIERIEKVRKGSRKSALAFGLFLSVALMTKMSALAFLPATLPTLFRRWRERDWKSIACVLIPPLAFTIFWLGRSYLHVGNPLFAEVLGDDLRIPNGLNHFFGVNLSAYFSEVAADPRAGAIREQLWNFLLVSALQGEFWFSEKLTSLLMVQRFFLLLGVTGTFALLCQRVHRPLLTSSAVALIVGQLMFYLAVNAMSPFSPVQDARYWAIAFPAIAWLVGRLYSETQKPALKRGYGVAMGALLVSFGIFFVQLLSF